MASLPMICKSSGQLSCSSALPLHTGWDNPVCTNGPVSVPRGSRAVMTCNISNTFADVTIWLITHRGKTTIFNNMPQGQFSQSGWELRVQEGQAQLVIRDTQDDHTGLYQWHLHGRQRRYHNITLKISSDAVKQGEGDGDQCTECGGERW